MLSAREDACLIQTFDGLADLVAGHAEPDRELLLAFELEARLLKAVHHVALELAVKLFIRFAPGLRSCPVFSLAHVLLRLLNRHMSFFHCTSVF